MLKYMMRGSGDSKKLQVFHQRACSVSRALWPAELRRSLAVGKIAPQRRPMLLSGKRRALMSLMRHTSRLDISQLVIVTSLFVAGTILTALLLHIWYLLLIPILMLTVLSIITAVPLLFSLDHILRSVATPTGHELKSLPGFPARRRAPETSMPATPLVRILETYDLSQTNVEHFLDTTKREKFRIPSL